jgi:type II secretory ATPase GspE/PulE/Tfp pilus assembly ATPase PilB-like protein
MSIRLEDLPLDLPPEEVVQRVITHAAQVEANDLFLHAEEKHMAVSARHLGILHPVCALPADLGRRCVALIKAEAAMDIAEKRRPQDGRWICQLDEERVLDLRISVLPTMYGEDLTLRLLERETRLLNLKQLGLLPRDYNQLVTFLQSPSGLILVTGPTGAGKTTTLYACLKHLHNGNRKINTIEDPIEYAIDGIRQSQVNPRLEVGFGTLLRSVLRQSPDVIMIGEIRDPETAEVAVRAANSGHLVLGTMHAPVAAGAIPTLLNLGVHPHFLASSLLGVLAQRLVRTLCVSCKTSFDLSSAPNTFDEVQRFLEPGQGQALYAAKGCNACKQLGFAGRTGVFEVMAMTPALRHLIMQRQPLQAYRRKATEEGLLEFRIAALLKVAQGETSIDEVFRAIPMEYLADE